MNKMNKKHKTPRKHKNPNDIGIKVIAHRVLLLMDKDEGVKTKGGIILTDDVTKTKLEQFASGTVIEMGDTAFDYLVEVGYEVPINVKDKALIKKHAGVEVTEHGGYTDINVPRYRIVNDEDVLAIIEGDRL